MICGVMSQAARDLKQNLHVSLRLGGATLRDGGLGAIAIGRYSRPAQDEVIILGQKLIRTPKCAAWKRWHPLPEIHDRIPG